jgi:hypothetical protein
MKANILEVWAAGAREMGERAAVHAHQFGWSRSMEELFGRVYVDAFDARAAALARRTAAPVRAGMTGAVEG